MQCSMSGEMLSAFVDGELTSAEVATVRAHLAQCAGCRTQVRELRQAVSLLQSATEVAPPADLRAMIAAKLAQPAATTCAEVGRQLDAYLEGELAPAEAARVQAHLAECTGCAERRRLHEETVAALRAIPAVEPPARVRAQVRAATQPRRRFQLTPVWRGLTGTVGVAAAAAALLVVLQTGDVRVNRPAPVPQQPDREIATPAPAIVPGPASSEASVATMPSVSAGNAVRAAQAPAAAVRRGVRRVMTALANRPSPQPTAREVAETPAAETLPAAVATADSALPEAVAAESEQVAAAPMHEPTAAPVVATSQPAGLLPGALEVTKPASVTVNESKDEPRRVNDPRPVEVKAFQLRF